MIIHNLTPHVLNFYRPEDIVEVSGVFYVKDDTKPIKTIPSEGIVRAASNMSYTGEFIEGLAVCEVVFGEPTGLPESKEGHVFVVSSIVASSIHAKYPERRDFYVPSGCVRNEHGQIIGSVQLARGF